MYSFRHRVCNADTLVLHSIIRHRVCNADTLALHLRIRFHEINVSAVRTYMYVKITFKNKHGHYEDQVTSALTSLLVLVPSAFRKSTVGNLMLTTADRESSFWLCLKYV